MYSTTDINDYQDMSTVDDYLGLSFDDFLNDAAENKRRKRQIPVEEMKISFEIKKAINDDNFDFEVTTKGFAGKKLNVGTNSTDMTNATDFSTKEEIKSIENQNVQENEIIASEYEFDEVVVDDNTTDYLAIDYIDLYKDTTNEDVEYTPATYIPTTTEAVIKSLEVNETNGIYSVFPWIATVFIKNNENNQFDYICDGAVLSERVVLTAARCILRENVTVDVENILVILGKRSLQENGPNEKVLRTTGWHVTGQLTPIYFDKESSKTCKKNTDALTTFCAVFGDG
ncbi:hypothetical protein MSG28_012613, partial [Choristoneura fumiferana]